MKSHYFSYSALALLFVTLLGYFFFDKSIATYFMSYYADAEITQFSHKIGSWTSSKKVCFLGLFVCSITLIKLLAQRIKASHPIVIISAIYSLSISIVFVIKGVLARYRPEMFFSDNLYGFHFFSAKHAFTSMPSGHAITAFTLLFIPGLFLWNKNKLLGFVFIVSAAFLAFSRVLTTDHYFSDVMLSFAISSGVTGYILSKIKT